METMQKVMWFMTKDKKAKVKYVKFEDREKEKTKQVRDSIQVLQKHCENLVHLLESALQRGEGDSTLTIKEFHDGEGLNLENPAFVLKSGIQVFVPWSEDYEGEIDEEEEEAEKESDEVRLPDGTNDSNKEGNVAEKPVVDPETNDDSSKMEEDETVSPKSRKRNRVVFDVESINDSDKE